MFEKFFELNSDSANRARQWKRTTGKKVIGVMPEYFPSEVITALGAYPVHFKGTQIPISRADTYLQSFSCTTTRTILEQAMKGDMDYVDGFVFTTMCDNQQNLSEVFKKLFPEKPVINFMIPFANNASVRQPHLKQELDKAILGISRLTGTGFTEDGFRKARAVYEHRSALIKRLYDVRRRNPGAVSAYEFYSMLKAGAVAPVEEFTAMLDPVISELEKKPVRPVDSRIIISGITPEPLELTRVFDEIGMYIVDDDLTNGSRMHSKGVLSGIDGASIDKFVFGGTPCPTLFNPALDRRAYLADTAAADKAAVVLWQIKFCEPEAFERPDLMAYLKQRGIPVTSFEVELQMNSFEGIKTRLQAFKEIL